MHSVPHSPRRVSITRRMARTLAPGEHGVIRRRLRKGSWDSTNTPLYIERLRAFQETDGLPSCSRDP